MRESVGYGANDSAVLNFEVAVEIDRVRKEEHRTRFSGC